MASRSQIEANRRNARQSTGPRSTAGKKRAGKNALRHGLSAPFQVSASQAKLIERLAQLIAGSSTERLALELAREAAITTFDLARIRRIKTGVIQRELAVGCAAPPTLTPDDPSQTLPLDEQDRMAEAVERALPELSKIERYEARAISRRNRVIRLLQLKAEAAPPSIGWRGDE
ncbi:hypothetical protein [Bradyrhizobium sp. 1(2017)]|uniref:hypothetical protein n=1 Tax=Bradyrhizobium sp. 1(2017) TaxID=1404888 RepID=UPI00140F05C2|nr:hypothetical protein [Bradyrhizobium sp. 1(2017)]QIO32785.1 hypothetical protein HAP40_13740 [Bradyrhizobium sp. 1(2017)]